MSIHEFFLSPDNPANTIITDADARLMYMVETTFPGSRTLTTVRNADKEVLAVNEWKEFRSDRVTLGKGKEMPLSDWLKKSRVPFNSTVTFEDEQKRSYKWKGVGTGEQMQLFADDFSTTDPIAKFVKSRPRANEPARLVLSERAMEIRDAVVLSFLFLEKSRRATDSSTQHKADVLGTPTLSIGATPVHNGGVP